MYALSIMGVDVLRLLLSQAFLECVPLLLVLNRALVAPCCLLSSFVVPLPCAGQESMVISMKLLLIVAAAPDDFGRARAGHI